MARGRIQGRIPLIPSCEAVGAFTTHSGSPHRLFADGQGRHDHPLHGLGNAECLAVEERIIHEFQTEAIRDLQKLRTQLDRRCPRLYNQQYTYPEVLT